VNLKCSTPMTSSNFPTLACTAMRSHKRMASSFEIPWYPRWKSHQLSKSKTRKPDPAIATPQRQSKHCAGEGDHELHTATDYKTRMHMNEYQSGVQVCFHDLSHLG
jgi:hypothetical protein